MEKFTEMSEELRAASGCKSAYAEYLSKIKNSWDEAIRCPDFNKGNLPLIMFVMEWNGHTLDRMWLCCRVCGDPQHLKK